MLYNLIKDKEYKINLKGKWKMKFTKIANEMMNELRENGINVNYNGSGFYTSNGYYVEVGSTINVYKEYELVNSSKTKKSAMNFLVK